MKLLHWMKGCFPENQYKLEILLMLMIAYDKIIDFIIQILLEDANAYKSRTYLILPAITENKSMKPNCLL